MSEEEITTTENEEESHPFDVFAPLGGKIVEALKESDFADLEALASASDKDIKAIKGIGQRSINPIRGLLAEAGFEAPEFVPEVNQAEIARLAQESPEAPQKQPPPSQWPEGVEKGDKYHVSTMNLVISDFEGAKYNFVIDQPLLDIPENLLKKMLADGEAREVIAR